jgi:cellulose biosynthesis protein BcsQ
MYVVTFYSFKGGVGRTMSLVNVGVELANKGRNVLLVDFDLEAPGIPTFDLFAGITDTPGIVDYVSEYLSTSHAPDVKGFITPCSKRQSPAGGRLSIMSAGRQDVSYAARFHAIDWQDLYANREGFLMFEDLKEQWRTAIPGGFHYVLIDSRTGHTDVGGICTRQLPDAVVVMFFPNEQNLRGLGKVVSDIRDENNSPRQKHIELHFVPSNVPDLDDEEDILQTQLERSQHMLGYGRGDATILHHYNSLFLLRQQIFVLDRPKSKLSEEYRALVNAIVSENLEDREGALSALEKMRVTSSKLPRELNLQPTDFDWKLSEIARAHERDSEILYRIAILRERMGRPEEALSVLDEAVQSGISSPQIFARRAQLYLILGRPAEAVADAEKVLAEPDVARLDLANSVRVIRAYRKELLSGIDRSPAIRGHDARTRSLIAGELMTDVEGLPAAERLLREVVYDDSTATEIRDHAKNHLSLCLIAQEKYDDAIATILREQISISLTRDIRIAFNYAMADWGKTGLPSRDLFSRVVELSRSLNEHGANYLQCLAIAHFVMGDRDQAHECRRKALREIRVNPRTEFSSWRYLEASPAEFRQDLEAVKTMIDGEKVSPVFIGRNKDLFSSIH